MSEEEDLCCGVNRELNKDGIWRGDPYVLGVWRGDASGDRVAKSLLTLFDQVEKAHPKRSRASDGTIGDRSHQARSSDHNPWVKDSNGDWVVTALDITHDPKNGCDAGVLAEVIRASRDERVKYLIYNRRICSGTGQGNIAWKWRPYHGQNDHTHHAHISAKAIEVIYDSIKPWVIA